MIDANPCATFGQLRIQMFNQLLFVVIDDDDIRRMVHDTLSLIQKFPFNTTLNNKNITS